MVVKKKFEIRTNENFKKVLRVELSPMDNVSQFGMKRTEKWPDYKPRL